MSLPAVDFGVVINAVHVQASSATHVPIQASDTLDSPPMRPRIGDHRIMIGELRVQTDVDLDGPEARLLGLLLVRDLTQGLLALQARRLESIVKFNQKSGMVWIRALHARLWGACAERHSVANACCELVAAIEQRLVY